MWRDAKDKRLKPLDALKIYALKTSPAFEAALYSGVRLAGPADDYVEAIKQFSRNMGVAFQILNDLKDWRGDSDNKLFAGGDTLGGRPTVLWALAIEGLPKSEQVELLELVANENVGDEYRISRVRQLYEQADVFEKAHRLVDKHQQRAEAIADALEPEELRRLFYYLIDTVLERPTEPSESHVPAPKLMQLSVAAP
jgi:geranylgeranyl pyrophosphate synthase